MSRRFQVVVTDYWAETSLEQSIFGATADVRALQAAGEEEVLARGADADALLVYHDMKLTDRSLAGLKNCRGIVRVGVGFDNVDLKAAGELGIVVCNVPDYGTEDVADHALMMMLAICRRMLACHESVCKGEWIPETIFGAPRLRGRTLAIYGCGRIGSAMAMRGKALGMRVLIYDPYIAPGIEKALGVERTFSLKEFLAQADVLSIHSPLNPETKHFLNRETLALIKPGAYVVNTARGPVVDLDALREAMENGRVFAAGLDVLEQEPMIPEWLRNHPRVLLSPHTAFYSDAGFIEMRTKACQEIVRMFDGRPVRNPVNLPFVQNARCKTPEVAVQLDAVRLCRVD